ncbi:hypothetical protein [Arthrobacter bambusae]|uniref:hypothetical protein n=1 Tax=Arthrobacter bambusae TaxID=1338426 RepID=UPI00277EE4F3|nr:hypothetical protein [Arthrobacter bambusae]MDQ0241211.1 hypothetical protein [Arthrobacter bambusae]
MSAPTIEDDMTRMASIAILKERHREHSLEADRYMTYTVYVHSTPTPDTAHDAVKVTENALKEHALAKASFHAAEAKRFKAALEELEPSA